MNYGKSSASTLDDEYKSIKSIEKQQEGSSESRKKQIEVFLALKKRVNITYVGKEKKNDGRNLDRKIK